MSKKKKKNAYTKRKNVFLYQQMFKYKIINFAYLNH